MRRLRCASVVGLGFSVLAAMTSGCYDAREVQAFLRKPRQPVSGIEYRVMPPDSLLITSQHISEINGVRQQIRPDGKINLPLLGEVTVAAKTPRQIEAEINKQARKYYEEVDVNVQIVGYHSQKFYIFGEVRRAGPFAWTGHDSLLDVLARAQPSFLAWPQRIIVVRGSSPQEGGQEDRSPSLKYTFQGVHPRRDDCPPRKIVINLWAMVRSGDMNNNILLLPNDVIYVQPNPLARLGQAIQSLLLPISPAAETVEAPLGAATTLGM